MKRIFKTTVTNDKTGKVSVGYSGLPTVEDAVAATLRRVEETTPLGELPNSYSIHVEIRPE